MQKLQVINHDHDGDSTWCDVVTKPVAYLGETFIARVYCVTVLSDMGTEFYKCELPSRISVATQVTPFEFVRFVLYINRA